MEVTELLKELSHLESLVETLRKENDDLRSKIHHNYFITLEFYIMARRHILNEIEHYKKYPSAFHLSLFKNKLEVLFCSNQENLDSNIDRLRCNLVKFINEAILECENYQKQ